MRVEQAVPRSISTQKLTAAAFAVAALGMAVDFRFRRRDPLLATGGDSDAQILFELAVWAGGAVWLVMRTLRSGRYAWINAPARLSKVIQTLGVFVILICFTSLYSPAPAVSMVRAAQWVILFGLVASLSADLRSLNSLEEFWIASRRAIWIVGTLAIVVSATVPIAPSFDSEGRYRLFEMGPVGVGLFLGLLIVTLVGSYLGIEDPFFQTRGGQALRLVALVLFVVLLVMTKTRGAMMATVGGVGVSLWYAGGKNAKRLTLLAVSVLFGVVLSGALNAVIESVIFRGQTGSDLAGFSGRVDLAADAIPLINENLFFGHGYLAARVEFLDLAWGAGSAHNVFIEVIFSMGLVGLLVLIAVLVRLVEAQRRLLKAGTDRQRAAAVESAALLVFLLLLGTTEQGFAKPGIEAVALTWSVLLATAGTSSSG